MPDSLSDHQVFAKAAIALAAKVEGHLRATEALDYSIPTAPGVKAALESFNLALQRCEL